MKTNEIEASDQQNSLFLNKNYYQNNINLDLDIVDIRSQGTKKSSYDLIKIIPTGIDTKVKIILSERIKAFLIQKNQEIEIKYENLPIDLKKISTPELFNSLLKDAYIKLATYSNGDIKFYISQRLKGGGKGTDFNNQGVEEYKKGNYEKALEYFSKAISEDNNENIFKNNKSDALNQIGIKLDNEGKYKEATDKFGEAYSICASGYKSEQTFKNNRDHAKAKELNAEGNKLHEDGNHEQAIKKYEAAYDICPTDRNKDFYKNQQASSLNQIGDKHYNNKEYLKAIEYYDKACNTTNKSDNGALYLSNKAHALKNLERYDEAIEYFDKAYAKKSNQSYKDGKASAFNAIAIKLDNQGKYDDAIRYYDAAISVKNEAAYHSNKAGAYNSLKQYNKAIDSANRALELDLHHSYAKDKKTYALNQIGNSLYNEEKYEEAIKKYDEAIFIKPGEAAYYNNKGNALYKLQKYQESIPFYEKAIELNSSDTSYFNNKVLALALAVQKQKKNLSVQDNAFLKKALLSDDLLHQKNGCLALSYASENGQKLSASIINNLLEISNKQELGDICEYSSKAVKHSLFNDKQIQIDSLIIGLLEEGLKHSNINVKDNIIFSLGYIARNGVEISNSIIHTIEDNLISNQSIESSIDALYAILGTNYKIDLKIKTTKFLLNIGINTNYSFKLQKQSLECLVQLLKNGKVLASEIIKDISLVLENQYSAFRCLGLEIIEHYLKNSGSNCLLPNNLINSLGYILETDTLPVLNILKQVSQKQKFPDQALSSLSNTLISADNDLTRSETLVILEDQNNKFHLKNDIKYLVRIEEETKILSSDEKSKRKVESLKFLYDQAKLGKHLTKNCLRILEQLLLTAEKELKSACSLLISSIVSNGQELPKRLSDVIAGEIIRNNELYKKESLLSKINIFKSKEGIDTTDLVLSLFKVIQDTEYVPENTITAFETCLTKNQSEVTYNHAILGLKILTQRGYKLSENGIENCINILRNAPREDLVSDLSVILKDISKGQIISKKAFDQIFELLPFPQPYIQDNLINAIEYALAKTSELESYFDSKKVTILEKLIKTNQVSSSLLQIIELIPKKTSFLSEYIIFEKCLQNLNIGNNEEKILSIVGLQNLIKKGYPLTDKTIETLQQNLSIEGVVQCLELAIDNKPEFIKYLNPELLSEEYNFKDYPNVDKIIKKCIENKLVFSVKAISNLANLLFHHRLEVKNLALDILNSLSKNQALPINVLNLIALEDNITEDNLPVLKLVCKRLDRLEELSENHIKKLDIILSSLDEELFYEGSQVALGIIERGLSLPDQLINKIISRVDNNKFVSDWLATLSNIKLLTESREIYFSKIIDCLEEDNLQIKSECLKNLKYLSELIELPNSVEKQILSYITDLTGKNDIDLISKAAIGVLGGYYAKSNINTVFKSRFNNVLEKIASTYLPQSFMEKLSQYPEDKRLYILSNIIGSDLINFDVLDCTSILEAPKEILLCNLLIGCDSNDINLQKFFNNLQIFEKNNNYSAYDQNRDQVLKLLIFQKEKYNLSIEEISDSFKFLSIDHSKITGAEFLNRKCLNILKANWLNTLLHKHIFNTILSKDKITVLLDAFEANNFHTALIEQFISKLQFSSEDEENISNQIVSFLRFIKANNVSQSRLLQVISLKISSTKNSLLEWQKVLSKQILLDTFKHNGENGCKLLDAGWDLQSALKLVKELTEKKVDIDIVKQAFDIINGYKIPQNFKDSSNISANSIFTNYKSSEWIKKLHKLAITVNFSSSVIEKNPEMLLKEIKERNSDIDAGKLKQQLKEIDKYYDEVKNWEEKDIKLWVDNECKIRAFEKEFLPKMLAVLSKVNIITSGNKPRATQLLSLLMMMDAKHDKGRIAQIATGEGKSTIVAMLAAVKALQGEKVDIITSSEVLAARDAEEKKSFFNLLKLTVTDNSKNNAPDCYKANIVYGDITDFEGDLLRHEFNRLNTKGDRGFGTVIVDEVDSMCIDNLGSSTRLGSHFVGLEYLDILLVMVWQQLDMLDKQIIRHEGKLLYLPPELKIENGNIVPRSEEIEVDIDEIIEIDDRRSFTQNLLKSNLEKIISENNNSPSENQLRIPKHLIEFAKIELDDWVDSAYRAKHSYNEKEDYVIAKSRRDGENVIAPVDYQNTGVVQVSTTWNNGLHQFLQIKHGLKITAENLTTSFISNIGYFNRYISKNQNSEILSNKIYGLTGTLGSSDSQELLKDTYAVDIVFVPTYKQKQFIELPAIVTPSYWNWKSSVVKNIQEETNKGRAVLVICQTIEDTEKIREELTGQGYPRNKIRVYGRSDNDDSKVIQNAIDVGDVIIATNLAGRGTDIKTTEALEKNSGLHVCVTFLPTNLRVEEQNFGRTSRQGKSGTAQLVLWNNGQRVFQNDDNIENIKKERDEAESKRLERIKSSEIERIKIKDDLFKNFCELMNRLKNLENDSYKLSCLEEQWGVWLRSLDLDDKEKTLDTKDVWNKFKDFELKLSNGYINGTVVHNPFSHIEKANDLLNNEKYKDSIEYYDKAINIDPVFSFAAHYNKAYALLQLKEYNYKQKALTELKEASSKIEKYISPQMQTVQVIFAQVYQANTNKSPNDTELHKQVVERCDIINNFTGYINHAIAVLEDSLKPENKDHEIKISNAKNLKYFIDQNIASKGTINQIKEAGLTQFYELNSKPPTPWLSIIAVAALGLVQATAGALITVFSAGTAIQIGAALISEGVSDLICATQAAITGNFSWAQYAAQKAISMTVSMVCMGWSALKAGVKAAKEGLVTGAKALKNVVVNGFKNIVSKVTGKQLQQTVVKGLLKEGLKTAVKQVVVKVAEKGIERLAVYGINKVIENVLEGIKDHTAQYFRQYFSEKLNSNNTVLVIDSLIAIDSYLGNNHWQNHIKRSAMEIIHPQKNYWLSHFESGLKQILPKVAGHYNESLGSTLNSISKILEFTEFTSSLSKLVFSFYNQFHQSLESSYTLKAFDPSKNGFNSLEHLIRDINYNTISEIDAQKMVILLHEQGVINNKGEFDDKILCSGFKEGFTHVNQRKILITSIKLSSVKNKINSIDDIDLGEDYKKYKKQIVELCKKIYSQLTTDHKFSRNKLYHEISEELLGSILNTFNDYMIRPATNRFIEQQVGNISEMIQERFNGITFAEEAKQYRSKYQLSFNVNNIGNDAIDEKIEHLPKEQKEIVRKKIKTQKGDITDLGPISSKLGKPIAIYKNGELYDIIGDSNQGNPIRLDYDPSNGGHWSPHGIKNFKNQELNNCLFEAVADEAKKQNIKTDISDLKVYAALDKIENTDKYRDIKLYYNHLASYNNSELLMQGGGRYFDEFADNHQYKGKPSLPSANRIDDYKEAKRIRDELAKLDKNDPKYKEKEEALTLKAIYLVEGKKTIAYKDDHPNSVWTIAGGVALQKDDGQTPHIQNIADLKKIMPELKSLKDQEVVDYFKPKSDGGMGNSIPNNKIDQVTMIAIRQRTNELNTKLGNSFKNATNAQQVGILCMYYKSNNVGQSLKPEEFKKLTPEAVKNYDKTKVDIKSALDDKGNPDRLAVQVYTSHTPTGEKPKNKDYISRAAIETILVGNDEHYEKIIAMAKKNDSGNNTQLAGFSLYGKEKEIRWIHRYFGKYTLGALSYILSLRINDLQIRNKNIRVLPGIFINQVQNNISDLINKISRSNKETFLVPLSLYDKHAVGIMFVTQQDGSGYKAFYLDPENTAIPEGLAYVFREHGYEIEQLSTEGQQYSNCGPEVIENFMLYLTGERLSQEDAIVNNSRLVEQKLLSSRDVLETESLTVIDSYSKQDMDTIISKAAHNTQVSSDGYIIGNATRYDLVTPQSIIDGVIVRTDLGTVPCNPLMELLSNNNINQDYAEAILGEVSNIDIN
ncbi:SecA-like and tetratricopeptide repeat-containing domain protein (plasmid) [Candidatus Megaera polyxenophila]|nr:SecA-like and tetratricopeptide repeat-containing domain protein [Candidatus Megaera polyxenophila]